VGPQVGRGPRGRRARDLLRRAPGHDRPAPLAALRPEVDHAVGGGDQVEVVLDHDHGVAPVHEALEAGDEPSDVGHVEAGRGLVEDVERGAEAGRGELGGELDPLGLAAGEGGCRPVEGEISEAHLPQEGEASVQFGDDVAGDCRFAPRQRKAGDEAGRFLHGKGGDFGDILPLEPYGKRLGAKPPAPARGTGLLLPLPPLVPPDLLAALLRVEAGQDETGAVTDRAPAVSGIIGEEARVGLGEAAAAGRARPQGGKEEGVCRLLSRGNYPHRPLAEGEGSVEEPPQLPLRSGRHRHLAHRQLDGVLPEAVEAGPGRRGGEEPVHPEGREPPARRPFRQVGVIPLAGCDKGGEKEEGAPPELPLQPGGNGVRCLGGDGEVAVRTMGDPELHEEEPQEVVDLGEGCHGAFAPSPAGALLDRHRGGDTEDRVHVGAGGRLDELPGIGVEGLQVAPLPLGEQDIEGDGALAGTGDAGNDREAVTGDGDVHVPQVVLPRL